MNRFLLLLAVSMLSYSVAGVMAQDAHDHEAGSEQETHEGHEEADEHDEHESELVYLTQAEMTEFGIILDTAGPGSIRHNISVPGEIAVNGDRIAHIVPRFTGVVQQVLKRIGDRVRTGDVLAVVESNEGLTPYDVVALMDGTVIAKQISVGEVHQGDSPAFIIADLDSVWVNLSIYQMHLATVRVGQAVSVTADLGEHFEEGVVTYISPVVDEHTRTATARVVLDNTSGQWRPGLLVEGRIATDSQAAAIAIPKTALFHWEDAVAVFVLTPEGFTPRAVSVGDTNHKMVEIVSGLEAGETYVAVGGFTIKAELQKGSFGDGHGH